MMFRGTKRGWEFQGRSENHVSIVPSGTKKGARYGCIKVEVMDRRQDVNPNSYVVSPTSVLMRGCTLKTCIAVSSLCSRIEKSSEDQSHHIQKRNIDLPQWNAMQ